MLAGSSLADGFAISVVGISEKSQIQRLAKRKEIGGVVGTRRAGYFLKGKTMARFRKISECEAAEISISSEQGRMLVMERDLLRDLVEAKDEYIACYKLGKRPSEMLLSKLERLTKLLIGGVADERTRMGTSGSS